MDSEILPNISDSNKVLLMPIKLMLALSLIIFLINIDYTAINLALPAMAEQFNSSLDHISWVLTAYVLTWAVLILPFGSLSQKYTNRQLCMLGMGLFIGASLIATIATTSYMLIIARIIQGVSAAIYTPAVYGFIYCNIPENIRGRAVGILSLGVGLGLALGPFIGGSLVAAWSWRGIFLINIPIGLIAFVIIYQQTDKQSLLASNISLHKTSIALIGFAAVSLIYILSQWKLWDTHLWFFTGWTLFTIMAIVRFITLQKRVLNPVVPLGIFQHPKYTACCIGTIFQQSSFAITALGANLYLQNIIGFSTLLSSIMFLFFSIAFGIIAMLGGRFVDRKGLVLPTLFGMLTSVLGTILFIVSTLSNNILLLLMGLLIMGIGTGLSFIGINSGLVKTVPQQQVGIATSVFMILSLISNSIGIVVTMIVYENFNNIFLIMMMNVAINFFAACYFMRFQCVCRPQELQN